MRPGYPFKKIHFDEMTNEEVMDGTLSPKRNLSSLFETSALEIRKIFQMIRRRRCAVSQIERGGIGNISFPEFSFLLSAIRNDKQKIYFFIFLTILWSEMKTKDLQGPKPFLTDKAIAFAFN